MAFIHPKHSIEPKVLFGKTFIDLNLKPEPPFNIASLFENGEQGFWLDPNDLSNMFQDAAGTIPVTEIGQPVGLILDKSGRGNHASQATSASRPVLRKNAITGFNYLDFDGVDDWLRVNDLDLSNTDKVSIFSKISKRASGDQIILEFRNLNNVAANVFSLSALQANIPAFAIRGTGGALTFTSMPQLNNNELVKIVGRGDIAEKILSLRVNSIDSTLNNANIGTGMLIKDSVYIARRGGTSRSLNGEIYSLICVSKYVKDSLISKIETYL